MKVELVTIGTELLLGATLDTNGAELGRALAAAGAEVVRRTSVPDRTDAVRDAVAQALERTGFVIATGGLGPTRDDVTKHVVAQLLGRPLVQDDAVLRALEERFKRIGRWPMPEVNKSQALVPQGAVVLPNARGTAPGLWLDDERGRTVILLPGVPSEMRGLLVEQVLPRLASRGAGTVVLSRVLRTTGVAESTLAERVGQVEDEIAPLTLAYLPGLEGVDLRLTAWAMPRDDAEHRLEAAVEILRPRLGEHFYGVDATDLAAVVLEQLRTRDTRLAVAESCTGGLIGQRLTAIPGASDVFVGGVVAYADQAKLTLLGVPSGTLERHGAVSEETVQAMVLGACRVFAVPCGLAVTGIAGPTGGSSDKPVGTVWLAASANTQMRVLKRVFPGDREEIRARSAQAALDLMRRLVGSG